MSAARAIAIVCLVLAAGCAGIKQAPPEVAAQISPPAVAPPAAAPNQDVPAAAEPPQAETKEAARVEPVTTGGQTEANEPVAGAQAPPARSQSAARSVQPPAKAPATVSAPVAAIEQPRKSAAPPPVARKPEPPLDITALKARLRDTNAIGVFTKLALKNQVDDLLQQFRAHYLSGQKTNVAELRQPYDMLVLKVLALIQDSDPSLARTISGSREAIWGILADPEKFNSAS